MARLGQMILAVLLTMRVAHAATPPTFEQLCSEIGIDASSIAELRQGKSFQRFPHEVSDRDIAAGVAFLTRQPPREVAALFFQFADVKVNPNVVASREVNGTLDFASLSLGKYGDEEAKRLLGGDPDDVNLSAEEIAAFHALGVNASRAAVELQLRKLLVARWTAYRERGLAGIAPYVRAGGKQLRGEDEIRSVMQGSPSRIARYAGQTREVLEAYPKRGRGVSDNHPSQIKESFRWIVYEDDKRPRVTLRHRMMLVLDDGNIAFSDREIYVSQGYNQMQGYAGMFAIDTGSLVLYRANTSTDRVEGSASGMKHSIGRKMMGKQLEAIFERFRDKLGK